MPKVKPKKDWSSVNQKLKDRKKKFKNDDRIYVASFNDRNQSKVIMRFLDSPDTDMPYVDIKSHFFNDVGGWFIDNCPTTINKECPVCSDLYANDYYNTDNDLYYSRKKSTNYYTNVLIVDDTNKPENNGKVFLFKFGTKIMEKIEDIIDEGKLPWDSDDGVNFVFSAKKNGKMTSYDASRFSDEETTVSSYGDEDTILSQRHSLKDFISDDAFKSYDDLKKKYEKVIGEDKATTTTQSKPTQNRQKQNAVDVEDDDNVEDVEDLTNDDMVDVDIDDDGFFDDLD